MDGWTYVGNLGPTNGGRVYFENSSIRRNPLFLQFTMQAEFHVVGLGLEVGISTIRYNRLTKKAHIVSTYSFIDGHEHITTSVIEKNPVRVASGSALATVIDCINLFLRGA